MTDIYLDHVLIAVRDLGQTAHTFCENLGFKVTPEGRHPGRGSHNRLVVFGPEYLELISIYDTSKGVFRPNMVPFLESREGLFIFAMGTRDVEKRFLELREKGMLIKEPVNGSRQASDGSTAYSWRQAEIDVSGTPGSQSFFIQHNRTVNERYTEPPDPTSHPNGVVGIHHLALAVHDADAASSRWRHAFGLAPISSEDMPGAGVRRVRLDLRNSFLDFVSPLRMGPLSDFLDRNGEAPYVLGLEVRDLSTTTAFLVERGVPTGDAEADADGVSVLVDPEYAHGVPLRLIQRGG